MSRLYRSLLILFVLLAGSETAMAQFAGSVGLGLGSTNNVQNLDTIAPDRMVLPAFEAAYTLWPGSGSKVQLAFVYSPNEYLINSPLSFTATTLSATTTLYLSNGDAIDALHAAEVASASAAATHHFGSYQLTPWSAAPNLRTSFEPQAFEQDPVWVQTTTQETNDSLVALASSDLYTLSGELDSTDIAPAGLTKKQTAEFEDLRDSLSDAFSTIADLLDSTGYSESVSQIVLEELGDARPAMARLIAHVAPSTLQPWLLEATIQTLRSARPGSDYLATPPALTATPTVAASAPAITTPVTGVATAAPSGEARTPAPASAPRPLVVSHPRAPEASAPSLTLVSSLARFRDFGAQDVTIHEDVEDSDATTMAAAMTIPLSFSSHLGGPFSNKDSALFGGIFPGNPNDSREFATGLSIEGLSSRRFSMRGAADYTRTTYAYDSIYSNSETRLSFVPRVAVSDGSVFFFEGALGFRNYLNPLELSAYDTIFAPGRSGKISKIDSAFKATNSSFSQYVLGLGFAQFIGERSVLGFVGSITRTPNLRAYITSAAVAAKKKKVRAAVQVADDEYTYDLDRITVFNTDRIFYDLDLSIDGSYEHRLYGSAYGPGGKVIPGEKGRKENGYFLNVSLGKVIPLETPLMGVFRSVSLEGRMEYASVKASQTLYSYSASNLTATASLGF